MGDHSDIDHTGLTGIPAAGSVATDAIWDAAGDLAVGSGANTAAKLTKGSALDVLRVNAGATNLEWAAPTGITAPTGGLVLRTAGDVSNATTSYADVTGASITITTGAHRVLVGWLASGYNGATTGHIALTVNLDTADQQELLFMSQHSTASESMNLSGTWMSGVLSAASHTFKLRMRAVTTGTATLNANASQGLQFWVAETLIAA